ncbi:unnamed protein product [Cuscuta epithymum]|uniref:Uncharacterized protein n=1 Tax=Cuscuta epithymum TaxID=186058 RepID=A0AAV0DH77_9ASTE|nr:unnamed protein product [Cuscuta epithymum]
MAAATCELKRLKALLLSIGIQHPQAIPLFGDSKRVHQGRCHPGYTAICPSQLVAARLPPPADHCCCLLHEISFDFTSEDRKRGKSFFSHDAHEDREEQIAHSNEGCFDE